MHKRIGILGGSFNPPHKGHVESCRYLLENNDCDQIWIIPCFKHPYGKELAPFKDRLTMCRFAFGEFGSRVRVTDIEEKIGGISHTIKTVQYIQQHNQRDTFYLITGEDIKRETKFWKDSAKLRSLIKFITIPRGEKSPIPNISSTEIRQNIKQGRKFTDLVTREVAVYIVTHGLYA